MNKTIVLMFVSALGLFLLTGCSNSSSTPAEGNLVLEENPESFETMATGSTGEGDVLIELTPHNVVNGKLEVGISANTHFISLDQFDLREITTLEFNGKSLKPVSAPALAGHHSSGTLVFDVRENVDSYTITIEGIPKILNRTFKWENKMVGD